MHDRSELAVRKMLDAVPSPTYDIGVQHHTGAMNTQVNMPGELVLSRLRFLKARNAGGCNIYIRPSGSTLYTLLDDLSRSSIDRMKKEGYGPCALVETSPANFQVWLRHSSELPKALATLAAKILSQRYGADLNAAGWLRFGRLAGFTNRKPKHRRTDGQFPFVLLHEAQGCAFQAASRFRFELMELDSMERAKSNVSCSERDNLLSPRRGRRSSYLNLERFRIHPKFANCPAAADLAFAAAALAVGADRNYVEVILREHYLSSDLNVCRQNAYIERTLRKAAENKTDQ